MKPARALDLPHRLRRQLPDAQSLAQLYADHLQLCRRHLPTSYSLARSVHGHMIRSGFNKFNSLLGLYVKFNKLSYAQSLFDELPQPDIVARNTMITAHSFRGHMSQAREVFDQTPVQMRDVVCYTALIGGYARNGDGHGALTVFKDMMQSGLKPDDFTLSALLSGLRLIAESIRECEEMHCLVHKSGTNCYTSVLTALLALYCTCASSVVVSSASFFNAARRLFDEIPERDAHTWTTMITAHSSRGHMRQAREVFDQTPVQIRNGVCYNALISGYARNGDGHGAVMVFKDMVQMGFKSDNVTLTSLLSGLSLIVESERECEEMHCLVLKSGTGFSTVVLNALLALYFACANSPMVSSASLLNAARRLFDEVPGRDAYTWTTMITGFVRNNDLNSAFELFSLMSDKLPVVWNAMISGYVEHGCCSQAIALCRKMSLTGIPLNEITYTSVLRACAEAKMFSHGKSVHAYFLRKVDKYSPTINNCLVTMYCECGEVNKARHIFNSMHVRDLASWNAVLSGYMYCGCISEAKELFVEMPEKDNLTWSLMVPALARNGCGEEALRLLDQMKMEGFEPCDYTFAGAINACSLLTALGHGRQLHAQVVRFGYGSSLSAGNSLIAMYSKCGVIQDARLLFLTMPFLSIISWNTIIAGVGQYGHGEEALDLFEMMLEEQIPPDRITYLNVIAACSNAGLVKEGEAYFNSMQTCYGITPGEDHYGRMIDLLCRAGKFSEAKKLFKTMPFEPSGLVWRAFLPGCKIHGNLELGIEAAEHVLELTPEHGAAYVLLANMYADAGKWDQAGRVRKIMRDRGVKVAPGCSWIEVDSNASRSEESIGQL